jgi:murein DD-endopeptidase MepM/ murein hydrolase activator NlpD
MRFLLNRINRMKLARGRRRRLIPLALIALLTLSVVPAFADPQDQLEHNAQKKADAQKRVNELEGLTGRLSDKVRVLDDRAARAQAEVDSLDAKLQKLGDRIDVVKIDLKSAQIRLSFLSQELQGILSRLDSRLDAFTARAVAAYMAGPTAYMEGLVTSKTFAELSDRASYYEAALEADSQLVEEIGVLRAETESKRNLVEKNRQEIADKKLRLETDRIELSRVRQERASILAARTAVLNAKEAILNEKLTKKRSLERIIAQLDADSASIRALLAGNSSAGPLPVGGGQLLWPAAGPVTSPYGYRTHPIFGDTRLHTGIDIGAPYGATVISAEAGSVAFAGVMSGYGNAVVIDHGGGLATLYGHLSAFAVVDGQAVGRGIPIANVGCSGYCTGPHLHFEVRINGNPVDPMPYLQ